MNLVFKVITYKFFPVEMKEKYILLYLCQYRYLNLIDIWLEDKKEAIEIEFSNQQTIIISYEKQLIKIE